MEDVFARVNRKVDREVGREVDREVDREADIIMLDRSLDDLVMEHYLKDGDRADIAAVHWILYNSDCFHVDFLLC